MNEEIETMEFTKFAGLCGIYAVFYTFCLYKNYSGITYPLFTIGTVVAFIYYLKSTGQCLKRFSYFLIACIVLIGLHVCLTASMPLAVLDRCLLFVLFFVLFLHNIYDDTTWDITRYIAAIIETIFTSVGYLPRPITDMAGYIKNKKTATAEEDKTAQHEKQMSPILYVLIGLAIAVPIVAIVLPLLISSDAVFSNTLKDIFSFEWNMDVIGVIVMIVVIFFVSYMLIVRLTERMADIDKEVTDQRRFSPIIAITVNTVLLCIYLLYCAIQIVYLFMGYGTLPKGYTYAEYVHEGFYQLIFVCLINIVLVLICRKYSKDSIALKVILCMISACTYIMTVSSAYRMALYVDVYGLTFLRLFVFWALLVIAVVMAGVIAYLFMPRMPFVKYLIVTVIGLWIIFAYMRPDFHIAKYDLINGKGEYYVTSTLSEDAATAVKKYGDQQTFQKYASKYTYRDSKLGIRRFNFSKWRIKQML